jgi:hypothetical protein
VVATLGENDPVLTLPGVYVQKRSAPIQAKTVSLGEAANEHGPMTNGFTRGPEPTSYKGDGGLPRESSGPSSWVTRVVLDSLPRCPQLVWSRSARHPKQPAKAVMTRDHRGKKGRRGFGRVIPDSSTWGKAGQALCARTAGLELLDCSVHCRQAPWHQPVTKPRRTPSSPASPRKRLAKESTTRARRTARSFSASKAPGPAPDWSFTFHHTLPRRPDSRDSRKLSRKQISGVRALMSHRGCQAAADRCDGIGSGWLGKGAISSWHPI